MNLSERVDVEFLERISGRRGDEYVFTLERKRALQQFSIVASLASNGEHAGFYRAYVCHAPVMFGVDANAYAYRGYMEISVPHQRQRLSGHFIRLMRTELERRGAHHIEELNPASNRLAWLFLREGYSWNGNSYLVFNPAAKQSDKIEVDDNIV